MGQRVTIAMNGKLTLSIDGTPTPKPLEVAIEGIHLDLDYLMENQLLQIQESDPSKVVIELQNVTLKLAVDANEVLSRGAAAIVTGMESL
jgi:hypothetical protein